MNGTYQETDETELTVLVLAAQEGDRQAFGTLFERFERHVMAIGLRRLGDFSEAQELCQDVFIQAMKKIDQLRIPEAFPGWIRQITTRMAINRLVRRSGDVSLEPEALEATAVEAETPLTRVLTRERATQVRKGLAKLGRMDR
jgi:RNA polymerase sigma-70 factor (ECF subfamily)